MYKLPLSMLILLLVIVGFSLYTLNLYQNQADSLQAIFDQLEAEIRSQDWEQAAQTMQILNKCWEETQSIWNPFLDHTEIENLSLTITRLEIRISQEETSDALTELAVSRQLVQGILEKELPSLQNIF